MRPRICMDVSLTERIETLEKHVRVGRGKCEHYSIEVSENIVSRVRLDMMNIFFVNGIVVYQ